MKFKQFLNENKIDDIIKQIVDKTPSSYVDAFINENISSEYYSWKSRFIFRGYNYDASASSLQFRKHPVGRVSANTSNEFTLMVDNILTSWKNFPKRSESFICSTSPFQAEEFGDLYLLFPLDNANVGICSENDMWSSLSRLSKIVSMNEGSVPDFNEALNKIYLIATKILNSKHKSIKTPKDVKDAISVIQTIIDDGHVNKLISLLKKTSKRDEELAKILLNHSNNFENNLNWVLDPIENDLELKQVSEISKLSKSYFDKEVWFSADAVFLNLLRPTEELIEIQDRMKKIKGK